MATHSSVLAWRIPGMAEPGGLPSVGSTKGEKSKGGREVAKNGAKGKKEPELLTV